MAPAQPMAPARWISGGWPVYSPTAISSASRISRSASPDESLMPATGSWREDVDRHPRRRHLREVVGEHRDVHRGGDPLVVRRGDRARSAARAPGGRRRRRPRPASRAARPGGPTGRRCRRAPGPRPSTAERDRDEEVAALVGIEGGRLPGAAGDEHRGHPRVDQPGGVVRGGGRVDLALVVEQGDEGNADTGEDRGAVDHGPRPYRRVPTGWCTSLGARRYGRTQMDVSPITYVRHAMPVPTDEVHPTAWHLDDVPDWREAARLADRLEVAPGASAGSSPAPSRRPSRRPRPSRRGGGPSWSPTHACVRRCGPGSVAGYRAVVHRYLRGELPDGWEPHDDVAARMAAAVETRWRRPASGRSWS